MTTLTKHGLEAAGFFLFCGLLLEARLQTSRQRIPAEPPPNRRDDPSYGGQWRRISYETAYGAGNNVLRVLMVAAIAICLIVAVAGAI
jgi:hypothetical protein